MLIPWRASSTPRSPSSLDLCRWPLFVLVFDFAFSFTGIVQARYLSAYSVMKGSSSWTMSGSTRK